MSIGCAASSIFTACGTGRRGERRRSKRSCTVGLVARLLHGSGTPLTEAVRPRVKDVGFSRCEILVRDAKGCRAAQTWCVSKLGRRAHVAFDRASRMIWRRTPRITA